MSGKQMDDFESLARRYWAAWGDALRAAAPGATGAAGTGAMPGMGGLPGMGGVPGFGGMPGAGAMPGFGAFPGMGGSHGAGSGTAAWQSALDWWTQLAHGSRAGANDALAHFNSQARDWYARMQEVAARFAGQETSAADLARAWKEALGASGENPFPEMMRTLRGHGLQGLQQWIDDASPWLESMRDERRAWLQLPAFGAGREHQERLQALALHMGEYQQASNAYNALLLKAQQEAFAIFESKLFEHEEPGRQLQSARALFDLWIDAAEEAYAEVAMSPEFSEVYGELVNSQMRVRGGVQRMVEDACGQFGMPTRSELDGAHRKLADLEREVRRLRDAVARGQAGGQGADAAAGAGPRASVPADAGVKPATRWVTRSAPRRVASETAPPAGTGKATRASRTAKASPASRPSKASTPSKASGARNAGGTRAENAGARRHATSRGKGFGSAIAGAVPRAPEPMASKDATAKKSAKKSAKKTVKKGKR